MDSSRRTDAPQNTLLTQVTYSTDEGSEMLYPVTPLFSWLMSPKPALSTTFHSHFQQLHDNDKQPHGYSACHCCDQ